MLHPRNSARVTTVALALLVIAAAFAAGAARADDYLQPTLAASTFSAVSPTASQTPEALPSDPQTSPSPSPPEPSSTEPTPDAKTGESLTTTPDDIAKDSDEHIIRLDRQSPTGEPLADGCANDWTSQWVPTGIIYHSYMAGPHEPRAGLFIFSDLKNGSTLGDATLGGRMGFWRYGNNDPVHPEGFQIDFYGAALARLDLENQEDLNSCDYVFGLPFTYGNEVWQMKFGYAHLSSHLGDEYALSHPGALANRINYSRDSIVWGNSYYPNPAWRVYEEVGIAVMQDDHAGRFTAQFGTELSQPGPTGDHAVPFLAMNVRARNDDNQLMGDFNIQAGWLRRGILGQTLRFGVDYYNGKSDQSQFYYQNEQQLGAGVWYDF